MNISETALKPVTDTPTVATTSADDFETFLKMLTTQIQNQDPLAPVSADDFANQLAAFSMVEQQTLTNQRLGDLTSAMEASKALSQIGMLGQTVTHAGAFQFFGSPVDLTWDADEVREPSKVMIFDDQGRVAAEMTVANNQSSLTWDGRDFSQAIVNPGVFSAQLVKASDGVPLEIDVRTSAIVEEIHFTSGAGTLLLSDGTKLAPSDVLQIR